MSDIISYSLSESENIDIIFDTNCEELIMSVDPDKIERIVLNLISNAIKFSKDNTKINIDINVDNLKNILEFSVKDTGIGMKEEDLERIFDRFTQVDDTMIRKNEGSGIGLSLVKIFTNMHGGNVIVNSKLGEGSEFIVVLPIKVIETNKFDNFEIDSYNSIESKTSVELSDIDF